MIRKIVFTYIIVITIVISVVLFNVSESLAFENSKKDQDAKIFENTTIHTYIGYRLDTLNWNIAGNLPGFGYINILSELEFTNLEILQAGFGIESSVFNRVHLHWSIHGGCIFDGMGFDSDYDENDRNGLWSRSQFEINNDQIFDTSGGVGYIFKIMNERVTITPLIGGSYHKQNLRLTNGVQIFATPGITPDLGPITDLNSTYQTDWISVLLGTDIDIKVVNTIILSLSCRYHLLYFEADANWNLRTDFQHPVSFTHESYGEGLVFASGITLPFTQQWQVGLSYNWETWWTEAGTDFVFLTTGQTQITRLNEVNWESQSINLSLHYRF
ncbi:MAG: hypothetical protein SVW57_03350 [Thermodesulfobacteriota bacterium]|nr:hypothetical protein [Thermodesulfobacteriota bacterium]